MQKGEKGEKGMKRMRNHSVFHSFTTHQHTRQQQQESTLYSTLSGHQNLKDNNNAQRITNKGTPAHRKRRKKKEYEPNIPTLLMDRMGLRPDHGRPPLPSSLLLPPVRTQFPQASPQRICTVPTGFQLDSHNHCGLVSVVIGV